MNEWNWKNRWYESHGSFWENGGWYRNGTARFSDRQILEETVAEAGITFVSSDGPDRGSWTFSSSRNTDMVLVAQGIVDLARHLNGGFSQLKTLLGGAVSYMRNSTYTGDRLAYTEWWPMGNKNIIHFQDILFKGGWTDAEVRGWTVHETAHLIDYHNQTPSGQNYSVAFPETSTISDYAQTPGILHKPEYFAEGVTKWVYPDWQLGRRNTAPLTVDHMNWLTGVLNGWGY